MPQCGLLSSPSALPPSHLRAGGGPHAAACAALLGPSRVQAVVCVASMTHTRGPGSGQLLSGMDWSNRMGYRLLAALPIGKTRALTACGALAMRFAALPAMQAVLHLTGRLPSARFDAATERRGPGSSAAGAVQQPGPGQAQSSASTLSEEAAPGISAHSAAGSRKGSTDRQPTGSLLTSVITPRMGVASAEG